VIINNPVRVRIWLLALAAATLACNTLLPPGTSTPAARSTEIVPALPTSTLPAEVTRQVPTRSLVTPTAGPANSAGVRACDYVPGVSVAAEMPPEVIAGATPTPWPSPPPPANTPVEASVTERHLNVFHDLVRIIESEYIYTATIANVLPNLRQEYETLVAGGLTDDDFYTAMDDFIAALGDEHSSFESPAQAAEADAGFSGDNDYVGIGVLDQSIPEAGRVVIISVFPGSPAAAAGLRSHDSLLAVDGQLLINPDGTFNNLFSGPEGSSLTLTVQRPGEAARDVTLQRARITGALPIDYCLVPGTRIGYLFLPGLDDDTIPNQVRAALRAMTADGPLAGLVLDNRQNGGGLSTVLAPILGLFTQGTLGYFVSRDDSHPLKIRAQDVGGSQAVPLVVLVGHDTFSYGEILSGLLQLDRAVVMGMTTLGDVETQWPYWFDDDSRVWLSHELFQPPGQAVGIWEETGIIPDVAVPSRWDLFTEATDPALAKAVDWLVTH
jgi:carboxyl-terminal processing protease